MKNLLMTFLAAAILPLAGAEKFCAVFQWEQNAPEATAILKDLQAIGEQAELVQSDSDFGKYDVLIVPKAVVNPVELRTIVPQFLAGGGHVILDGWPEKTFSGKRYAPEWGELLPGTTHVVKDSAHTHKGMRSSLGVQLTLKGMGDIKVQGAKQVNGRTINKCQWRLTGAFSTGRLDYHDCMDASPILIYDNAGKVIGQHTALVKHFCAFFTGANVVCADVQDDPSLKLLYGKNSQDYLKFLLGTVRNPLKDEPPADYVTSHLALRKKITELKLVYTESVYLWKELYFHSENNRQLGLKSGQVLPTAEFKTLEKESLELCEQFAKFRFNRFPFAVKRKQRMIVAVEAQIAKLKEAMARWRAVEKELLKTNAGRRFVLPERGIIDIKLSYADYEPLSWGGAPGFVEFENGRNMAALGIDGSCSTNYVNRSGGFQYPDDEVLRQDEFNKQVFLKYVEETGLKKFTSHEIPTNMISKALAQKAAQTDVPYVVDLAKGTLKPAGRNFTARLGGMGIISSATEQPEFQKTIEFMAQRAANLPGVHTRSITFEGMLMGGYSEYGFAKYREFLKERHKTIENLNQAWGSSWKSFDEIRPLHKFQKTPEEYANNFDWVEFRNREFNRFIKNVSDTYRKYDPNHQLTACINQVTPLEGLEFYEFNKYIDFAASHNTPTSKPWYQIGLARRGQRADNNEPKWLSSSAPWNISNAEDEVQKCQRFNMLYYATQGMNQFAPYEWRHTTSSRFAEMDGMLYLGGAEFKEFIRWKNKWQNLMGAVAPKDHAKTGIYWSFVTKSQGRGGIVDGKIDQSLFCRYFGLMDNWNSLFDLNHIQYEVVPRGKVKNNEIAHLKTLVVPQATYLEPEVMEKLLDYAKNGGELILEGQVGRYDQYHKEDNRIFDEVGIVQLPAAAGKLADGSAVQPLLTQEEVSPPYIAYELLVPEEAEVLCRYADNKIAAVAVKYGKGRVICTGFSLTGNTGDKIRQNLLRTALSNKIASTSAANVRLFPWQGQNGFVYLAVLNFSGEWRSIPVAFNGEITEAYDVETGVKLNRKGQGVAVPVFPAGGRIIAVKVGGAK